jgi:glycosyltransferase involved in cell wall biosynthesis
MKLLIITQVIGTEHPILGFFHGWVMELSKHCKKIHVICLEEGAHSFPSHVIVHSLGKESGKGRATYIIRFFSLIWKLRHEYDNVFVHMNQIYVILGAPFWRALGKPIGLWYAHGTVTTSLKVATFLTNFIFTSTPEGFRIDTPKRVIVGQGIDTTRFVPGVKSPSEILRLITVGRISTSKNIDTLLRACAILKDQGAAFQFKIVGVATTEGERIYQEKMKSLASTLDLDGYVEWTGPISNRELPTLLQQSDIFIHDGATNSLDKTLLEASLCGCIVVSSNPAYRAETEVIAPQFLFVPKDADRLATIINELPKDAAVVADRIRTSFASRYSIERLITGIVNTY